MSEQRRGRIEHWTLTILLGLATVYFLLHDQPFLALACALIAGLNLPLVLLWGLFLASFLGGLLCALLSVLWVIPLQFIPVSPHHHPGESGSGSAGGGSFFSSMLTANTSINTIRVAATGIVAAIFSRAFFFPETLSNLAIFLVLLTGLGFAGVCHLALKLRMFIKDNVVTRLLLPALKVMEMPLMNGQYSYVEDLVQAIRNQMLCSTELLDLEAGGDGPLWTSLQIPGRGCVIDAAYLRHPDQHVLPPAQQRWVLWFNGNGELFEFLLPELQVFAARSGLNMFAFNFRGVGYSSGQPHSAEDLVADGILCLRYITDVLGARPEHVLLFGHSLGGAIAPLVRADTSPTAPVVSERSFCSLAAAAQSVLGVVIHAVTGFAVNLPQTLVQGLLNSVFKGHMNVVAAWRAITGARLIIYTTRDTIIPYKSASLHQAVTRDPGTDAQSISLSAVGNLDPHNTPLQV